MLPERKQEARARVRAWIMRAASQAVLRINAAGTPWHEEDLEFLPLPGVRGVMVPKAESAELLEDLAAGLRDSQVLVPLVEKVRGHYAAVELARAPRVERLAFGSIDFMADAGIRGDAEELDPIRTHLVLASRLAGIAAPLDGVTLSTDDAARLEGDVQRARRFGMGRKLCIHPRQVAAVHAGFTSSAAEIDWARRVVDALSQGTLGAVVVDGKMVDRPIELLAKSILEDASAR